MTRIFLVVVVMGAAIMLSGCDGEDSTAPDDASTVTLSAVTAVDLVGYWVTPCALEGGPYIQDRERFLVGGGYGQWNQDFSDAACTAQTFQEVDYGGTFSVGIDQTTSNGTVSRIDVTLPASLGGGTDKIIAGKSGDILYVEFAGDTTAGNINASGYPIEVDTGTPLTKELRLLSESDGLSGVIADGTWLWCYTPSNDQLETWIFNGTQVSITTRDHGTSDGTCSDAGVTITAETGSFTARQNGSKTLTNWSDETNNVAAPMAGGGGSLSATPTVTLMLLTGTYGGADLVDATFARYIDDTGATWMMYRDDDTGGNGACLTDVDGYADCASTVDPLPKQ